MLTISNLAKAYADRTLFRDVTLQVNRGERYGLVGPNGAGKTTMFELILGEESADEGSVHLERNVRCGFLPQESAPVASETVMELATAVTPQMAELRRRMNAWESGDDHAMEGGAEAHAHFDALGGYELEVKARKILTGLSFRDQDFDRPASELSGGWVMRAHLARLLVQEPDLLMLDEPTNHLDLDSLIWFQNYLKSYPGAILMISHDREFLNQLVHGIIEIRQARVFRYRGNYDSFLEQREANEAQLLAAYKNQQREIAQLMDFVNRFRAKNTKAAQAQSKLKQIERMEKLEAPVKESRGIHFSFPQPNRSGHRVIALRNVDHAYGDLSVYRGLEFEAERGQRIVLVGPNGAGKSTLLKLLADVLPVQSGERELGHNVRSGYYAQYRVEMLHPDHTVLEEALDTPQRVTEQYVRTVLGSFLFRGDDVFKKVAVLSGGEKSRLALVKLLLDPPNLLLMDEPTTHLDMSSIDALVGALKQFSGTLVFISHDVYFIRELANHVVHVKHGVLRHFPGGYQYFLDKTAAEDSSPASTGPAAGGNASPTANANGSSESPGSRGGTRSGGKSKEQKRLEAEQRQERYRARRKHEKRVGDLESQIAKWEARQLELTEALERPETYEAPGEAIKINRELTEVVDLLEKLNREWEEAAAKQHDSTV